MRPPVLNPLYADVTTLNGVGPKLGTAYSNLLRQGRESARLLDLLFHLPDRLIDRRNMPEIARAAESALCTILIRVDRHEKPGNSRQPYKVMGHDETGELVLTFFRGQSAWLEKQLPVGEMRYVSGKVEWFNGRPTMVHPDYIVPADALETMPLVEPVYPLTAGVSLKIMARTVRSALDVLPDLPEWQDASILAREKWPGFGEALTAIHNPQDMADLSPECVAWRRLAYDELLAGQLALTLVRARMKRSAGKAWRGDGGRRKAILDALPFDLTGAQARSVAEIIADMEKPERMLRMLQGDVGSGKTAVALLCAAGAVEAGGQAAIMAPTEVLARQHLSSMTPLAEAAGMRIEVFTGREKGAVREKLLADLASGTIDIVVGTHALFQANVEFANLALAVVDEQHRFGVHQRLALAAKGSADVLIMTATPIPRTLVLAYFGDMEVSKLDEKPANRLPIQTNALPIARLDELMARMGQALKRGDKAYWVCPLVEDSDELDVTSAETRFKALSDRFGDRVGLVHGRLKPAEKDAGMAAFKEGKTRILVATTVIEVGVDVPDATIIIIEHAERFGLAQLHQLRGRVGRGDKASSCLLLYKAPLSETGEARLNIMRETQDGFRIAEEDLRLRGEGEILGTRQSGSPGFRLARMESHGNLMEMARDDARLFLQNDPELKSPRGEALRALLYLFGKDEAVKLLRAG
jgi:ATP-dependent DNA helicase RecG